MPSPHGRTLITAILLATVAHAAPAAATPDVTARVAKLSAGDRAVVEDHLARATSAIRGRHTELRVAAAVNTYLHQYIQKVANLGNSAKILADGQGACGGSVAAMLDMLHLAGIEAAHAYTLGIFYGGNHSMVEVHFADGRRGLFDPYHGAFWRTKRGPVGIARLIRSPQLSDRSIQTDRYAAPTRPRGDVEPMRTVRGSYDHDEDGVELTETGRVWMDWEDMFADNLGWGVDYSGRPTVTPLPIRAGVLYGTHAPGGSGDRPWIELARADDATGRNFAWPYVVGTDTGTTVEHVFQVTGRPGAEYILRLSYAQAIRGPALVATIDGEERRLPLHEFWYDPDQPRVEIVDVPFRQRGRITPIHVRADGYVLLQGIEVVPARTPDGG